MDVASASSKLVLMPMIEWIDRFRCTLAMLAVALLLVVQQVNPWHFAFEQLQSLGDALNGVNPSAAAYVLGLNHAMTCNPLARLERLRPRAAYDLAKVLSDSGQLDRADEMFSEASSYYAELIDCDERYHNSALDVGMRVEQVANALSAGRSQKALRLLSYIASNEHNHEQWLWFELKLLAHAYEQQGEFTNAGIGYAMAYCAARRMHGADYWELPSLRARENECFDLADGNLATHLTQRYMQGLPVRTR